MMDLSALFHSDPLGPDAKENRAAIIAELRKKRHQFNAQAEIATPKTRKGVPQVDTSLQLDIEL